MYIAKDLIQIIESKKLTYRLRFWLALGVLLHSFQRLIGLHGYPIYPRFRLGELNFEIYGEHLFLLERDGFAIYDARVDSRKYLAYIETKSHLLLLPVLDRDIFGGNFNVGLPSEDIWSAELPLWIQMKRRLVIARLTTYMNKSNFPGQLFLEEVPANCLHFTE